MDLGWFFDIFLEFFLIKVTIQIENSDFSKIIENHQEPHTFERSRAGFESRKLSKNGLKN